MLDAFKHICLRRQWDKSAFAGGQPAVPGGGCRRSAIARMQGGFGGMEVLLVKLNAFPLAPQSGFFEGENIFNIVACNPIKAW
jgi:hypothetical protein